MGAAVTGTLTGLKVLDMTDERAIYGAKLLADLGAEVLRPQGAQGDPLCLRGPFDRAAQESLWYAYFASSRTVVHDADSDPARLLELIGSADVLLWCDSPLTRDLPDPTTLSERFAHLIVIDVSSFGRFGPWQDYLAPDLVAGALGGAAATTGDVDTPPLKAFGELNFMVSGVYVAIAALAGVYARSEGGGGQRVGVSVHETLVSCLEQVLMFYWYGEAMGRERVLPRRGALHWSNAYAVLNGVDGSIMVTPTPNFDRQLVWLIEEGVHDDLIDPKYSEPENLGPPEGPWRRLRC
ncbi:MAG: CoA transferase [Pseudomonadota bacterium]